MFRIPNVQDIKNMRKNAGLTQSELAKRANVSQSLIARIESGSVDPRLSTITKIIQAIESISKRKTVRDILNWKVLQGKFKKVISVSPDQTIRSAATLMKEKDVSQLPVIEDGKVVGSIQETTIVKHFLEVKNPETVFRLTVRELMEEEFPILTPDADLEHLKYLISSGYPAVIVREKGSINGLISKIDLISYSKESSN